MMTVYSGFSRFQRPHHHVQSVIVLDGSGVPRRVVFFAWIKASA